MNRRMVYDAIPGGGRYRRLADGRFERIEGPELDGEPPEPAATDAVDGVDGDGPRPPSDDGGAG